MSGPGAEDRLRLAGAGLTPADFAWFDSFGWDPARVPAPEAAEVEAYRRREAALNAVTAGLAITEKAHARDALLAAQIGARLADFRDAQDRAGEDDREDDDR